MLHNFLNKKWSDKFFEDSVREKRGVWGIGSPEPITSLPDYDLALDLITNVGALLDDKSITGNPKVFLDTHPFATDFLKFITDNKAELTAPGALNFSSVTAQKGVLTLKYDNGLSDFAIDGFAYITVFYDILSDEVLEGLVALDVDDDTIDRVFNEFPEEYATLLDKIATEASKADIDKAFLALKQRMEEPEKILRRKRDVKAAAPKATTQARLDTDVKKEVEKDRAKRVEDKFGLVPYTSDADKKSASKQKVYAKEKASIDRWIANINRDDLNINAHNWNPYAGETELEAMRDDWIDLGIPAYPSNVFYHNLFQQLSKSFNPDWLASLGTNETLRKAYKNPTLGRNLDLLQKEDPDFYRAWEFYDQLKKMITLQSTDQTKIEDAQADLDKIPYAEDLVQGAKKLAVKFQDAVREGDHTLAAMYILGMWATYKAYKTYTKNNPDSKLDEYFIYGLAGVSGVVFLKHAGFDVCKKFKFVPNYKEVEGTSLAFLVGLKIPEVKNVDHAFYLRSAGIRISGLYDEYLRTSADGDKFIDPSQFPDVFPEFQMNNPDDRAEDKDYRYAGEQLYWILHCAGLAYEKTLMIDPNKPQYDGSSFGDILSTPPHNTSSIFHFMESLRPYAKRGEKKRTLLEANVVKKARDRFSEVFNEDNNMDWRSLAVFDNERQIVSGWLMDYPIIIVPVFDEEGEVEKFEIFSKKRYEENEGIIDSDAEALGVIPAEGSAETGINDLRANIKGEVDILLENIRSEKGRFITRPHWDKTDWVCEIDLSGEIAADYNIDTEPRKAVLIPNDNGGINMKVEGIPTLFNFDNSLESQFWHATDLINRLSEQEGYKILKPMKDKTEFVKDLGRDRSNSNIRSFRLRIAGNNIDVTYNKSKNEFTITDVDQARLLKNPEFISEYTEGLGESMRMKETFDKLERLVKYAPEQGHLYFFEGFWGMITGATADMPFRSANGDFLSGSIPDFYTNVILESKKQALLFHLQQKMESASDFASVYTMESDIISSTLGKLESLAHQFETENEKKEKLGEAWNRNDFLIAIVRPIQHAGLTKEYGSAQDDFELYAMEALGLRGSDVFSKNHKVLAHLKGVYAYHTAYLDEPGLDSIEYPYDSTNLLHKTNKELYLKVNYFQEVKHTLIAKAREMGDDIETLPGPGSFGIPSWDMWKKRNPDKVSPLNIADNSPPYSNITPFIGPLPLGVPAIIRTELQYEFYRRLNDFREFMVKKYATEGLKISELNNIFNLYVQGAPGTTSSELIENCATINSIYGSRRSLQDKAIDDYVKLFANAIYTDKAGIFWEDLPALDALKLAWYKFIR